jgi:hypothetical protein
MVVQKEKKRGTVGRLPKAKLKERFLMSPQALSKSQRSNLALLLMMNASIAIPRGIKKLQEILGGSEEEEEK